MVGFNEGDEALRLYSPAFPLSVLVFVSYFYFFFNIFYEFGTVNIVIFALYCSTVKMFGAR